MFNKNFKTYRNLALIAQIGIMMAVYIVGSIVAGHYIDEWLNSSPIGLLVCLLLGVIAAFYNVFKMLFKIGGKEEDSDPWKK